MAILSPIRTQNGLVVDNFAGGGGASLGIELGLGRPVDFAINHDPQAVAMHIQNHPNTRHFCESVWDVNPKEIVRARPMELGWFSPDCTFYSKARGGKPFRERHAARRRRGLAWLVVPWIKAARPKVIMLENVEEFADWGPLLPDGMPDPARRGMTFRRWHRQIQNLGYDVDMRELRACDYGAPTTRKRLFVIARCDGGEIVFPEPTHGYTGNPYRSAAECIDWSISVPSIFTRDRPLVDATLRRIARGVWRYVINNPRPFIAPLPGTDVLMASALLNTRNGERLGQAPRVRDLYDPMPTVTAQGSQGAIVVAFLARHYGGHTNDGHPLDIPMSTITTQDHHHLVASRLLKLNEAPSDAQAQVRAFLMAYYYGKEHDSRFERSRGTATTKDPFGVVTIQGEPYAILDIGMRGLTPRELYRAQSFPDSYIIDAEHDGKALPTTAQIRMCGNSVCPAVAEALVRANCVDQQLEIAA